MKVGLLSFVVFLLLAGTLFPVEDAVNNLLIDIHRAVLDESYTRAIQLLEEGKKTHPKDPRLPMQAGNLYKARELYRLALAEFQAAAALDPQSPEILSNLADTYGYLGNNNKAVEILEDLLEIVQDQDKRDRAIDDLSWMYFKTSRMDEGIKLLENALENRFDRNWAHTLGTLYSGVYDLNQSRHWYQRSIDDALESGDEYLASVAYYNLALLEFSFYLYDNARAAAERSLELGSRAGGHMVLGELDFLNWRLASSLESYRKAEGLDHTPLARVNIASYFQRVGRLDEAIRFIDEVIKNPDESWMYHFGIDSVRFAMDLSRILGASWKGKAKVDAATPRWGWRSRTAAAIRRLTWNFRGLYHNRRYRSLAIRHVDELRRRGNELDAAWGSYLASGNYRRIATIHLSEARDFETKLMPQSIPWYLLEYGLVKKDPKNLTEALSGFAPNELEPYERTLRGLSSTNRLGFSKISHDSLAELYRMNPGGLRQYGLTLPIRISVVGTPKVQRTLHRRTRSLLKGAGYRVVRRGGLGSGESLLTIAAGDKGNQRWFLADPDGKTRASKTVVGIPSRRDLAPLLAELLDRFYAPPPMPGDDGL